MGVKERRKGEKEESAFLTVKSNQEGKEEAIQTFHLE